MLLGQAESGKSTLQKQFQLYYACQTLDKERPTWRPIVYFNILKAIRMILDELEWEYGLGPAGSGTPSPTGLGEPSPLPGIPLYPSTSGSGTAGSGSGSSSSHSRANPAWFPELAQLRNKLLPLVASEDALAGELSGGVTVAGGRTGVYVRAGWQALTTANRSWPLADDYRAGMTARQSAVTNIVATTLAASQGEIEMLWYHPGVQGLLRGNKLKLEEYAALCVFPLLALPSPAGWIRAPSMRCVTETTDGPTASSPTFGGSRSQITSRRMVRGSLRSRPAWAGADECVRGAQRTSCTSGCRRLGSQNTRSTST